MLIDRAAVLMDKWSVYYELFIIVVWWIVRGNINQASSNNVKGNRERFSSNSNEVSRLILLLICSARDTRNTINSVADKHFVQHQIADCIANDIHRVSWQTLIYPLNANFAAGLMCTWAKNEIAVSKACEKVTWIVTSCSAALKDHLAMIFWFTMWQSFLHCFECLEAINDDSIEPESY